MNHRPPPRHGSFCLSGPVFGPVGTAAVLLAVPALSIPLVADSPADAAEHTATHAGAGRVRLGIERVDDALEVLDLVAGGLSNAAIAQRLFLSDKAVRNVVSTVLAKTASRDRAAAVLLARGAGLGG